MTNHSSRLHPRAGWALALAVAGLSSCTSDEVVAKVGRSEIRRAEVTSVVNARAQGAPLTPAEALDALVSRELLAEGARRAGLSQDEAVRARLHSLEREVLAQAMLERATSGIDEKALRDRYEKTKDEFRTREVHVAQIFLAIPSGASDEDQARLLSKATAVYARLVGGDDFAEVAKEVSDDRPSAERGGELEVVREGQVAREFFEAAVELKAGQLSKPVRTPWGFHLLKALRDPTEVVPPFDEVRGVLLAAARRELEASLRERLGEEIRVTRYADHLPEVKK